MTAVAALVAVALTGLLALEDQAPVFDVYRVPDRPDACRAGALFEFTLARPARVRLTLGGQPARTAADGRPLPASYGAGTHRVYAAPPERIATGLSSAPFVLEAEDGEGVRASAQGEVRDEIANRSVAPVGHLFASGVDLQDGHLLVRASDLTLTGRHLPLETSRTYSSAGPRRRAPFGAGWSGPYDGRLAALEECGLFVVQTSDGGSQAFRPDGSGGLAPQRGYHTRLVRQADGSFDFFDKAGRRYRFGAPDAPGSPLRRLEHVEEPHGDRVVLAYDQHGRLARADEWHPAVGAVRTLLMVHARVAGAWRVRRLDAWGLGLSVEYRYDRLGNLVSAIARDAERPGGTEGSRYEYTTDDPADPHRLKAQRPAGAPRVEYRYHEATALLAGTAGARVGPLAWSSPRAFVRRVEEATAADSLAFGFDHERAAAGVFRATTTTGEGVVSRYVLNADGGGVDADEPDGTGRTAWHTEWDPRHLVATRRRSSAGETREYEYDERGNLVSQVDRKAASARPQRTAYVYHPRFNLLTRKQDPTAAVSEYELHPVTGDLLRSSEPGGKVTRYEYTPEGCLAEKVEGDVRTRYREHDTFCLARLVVAPDGQSTRYRYDQRGRKRDATP